MTAAAFTPTDAAEADRRYSRRRAKAIAYGTWKPTVDAEPIREHLRVLRALPLTYEQIGDRAGLAMDTVYYVLFGRRGQAPRRIRHTTAEAILAVRPETPAGPPLTIRRGGTTVDPTGTRRRLQALVAIGYTQRDLAARLGITPPRLSNLATLTDPIRLARARQVEALYAALSMTPGLSGKARGRAERLGWQPPLAWDDDTIDDPQALPAGTLTADVARILADPDALLHEEDAGGNPPLLSAAVEAIRFLVDEGCTDAQISHRLGGRLSRGAVGHVRQRYGFAPSPSRRTKVPA